jgi:Na+/proline symporter
MKSRLKLSRRSAGRSGTSWLAAIVPFIGLALIFPTEIFAQEMPAATRLEMRHFWHVFIAYALAWVILFGWVLSILKRLRRVEEKLD